MAERSDSRHPWMTRIGWLLLLWTAGVATLAAIALMMRALLLAVGLADK
jgi:hypothetical protein